MQHACYPLKSSSVAVIQTCTVEPLPEDPDRFQGQNVAETIRGWGFAVIRCFRSLITLCLKAQISYAQ